MSTTKYKSETGRIFEYKDKEWYYYKTNGERRQIPNAAFYESGKNELLDKLKVGKIEIREFLEKGRGHKNIFNIPAYLFVPLKINGKTTIKKTKELTKI